MSTYVAMWRRDVNSASPSVRRYINRLLYSLNGWPAMRMEGGTEGGREGGRRLGNCIISSSVKNRIPASSGRQTVGDLSLNNFPKK